MSATHDLSFVGKKTADIDSPYAVLKGTMFGGEATFKILKKNTKDLSKQYASVLVAAETPATFGLADIGDTYVADLTHFNLAEVDGRAPTPEEFTEWAELRGHLTGGPDHGAVYSMTEIMEGAQAS